MSTDLGLPMKHHQLLLDMVHILLRYHEDIPYRYGLGRRTLRVLEEADELYHYYF